MVAKRAGRSERDGAYRRACQGRLRPGDTDLLAQWIEDETDYLELSRLTRAADDDTRGLALLRLSALEPASVDRHLAVCQHYTEQGARDAALRALDVAESLAPEDRRVMWARLDLAAELPIDEVAAVVAFYESRFAGDPILNMVRSRCRRLASEDEPTVVLDPATPLPRSARGRRPAVPSPVAPSQK